MHIHSLILTFFCNSCCIRTRPLLTFAFQIPFGLGVVAWIAQIRDSAEILELSPRLSRPPFGQESRFRASPAYIVMAASPKKTTITFPSMLRQQFPAAPYYPFIPYLFGIPERLIVLLRLRGIDVRIHQFKSPKVDRTLKPEHKRN
jgi:hypothetical protein